MKTPDERASELRNLEGHIVQLLNWSDALRTMGLGTMMVPPGVVLEIGTQLNNLAGDMRDTWEVAAGVDGR